MKKEILKVQDKPINPSLLSIQNFQIEPLHDQISTGNTQVLRVFRRYFAIFVRKEASIEESN